MHKQIRVTARHRPFGMQCDERSRQPRARRSGYNSPSSKYCRRACKGITQTKGFAVTLLPEATHTLFEVAEIGSVATKSP
jgi:hypothetical protein